MISVAMCTYNGAHYIEPQLNSILAQKCPVDEIVLCDDGSSDDTVPRAERLLAAAGMPHQIVVNRPNKGVVRNFEQAISLCSGDIVFTCDQDDVWHENKTELFCARFGANPACLLAFSDADITDAALTRTGDLWDSVHFTPERRALLRQKQFLAAMAPSPVVAGAVMAVRRTFAVSCIPFSPDTGILHDDWLALCAAVRGEIEMIEQPTICYRQHASNVIGARRSGLAGKAQRWFASLSRQPVLLESYLERADMVHRCFFAELPPDKQAFVQRWYTFASEHVLLAQGSRLAALRFLVQHARKGDYAAFLQNTDGWEKDLLAFVLTGAGRTPRKTGEHTH